MFSDMRRDATVEKQHTVGNGGKAKSRRQDERKGKAKGRSKKFTCLVRAIAVEG